MKKNMHIKQARAYVLKNIESRYGIINGNEAINWLEEQVKYYCRTDYMSTDYTKAVLVIIISILELVNDGISIDKVIKIENIKMLLLNRL